MNKQKGIIIPILVILLLTGSMIAQEEEEPEYGIKAFENFEKIWIFSAPDTVKLASLPQGWTILDFSPLADNSAVLILALSVQEEYGIFKWDNWGEVRKVGYEFPRDFIPTEIEAHPQESSVFILGKNTTDVTDSSISSISSLDLYTNVLAIIFQDPNPLTHLIISPVKYGQVYSDDIFFRLFFARETGDAVELLSINEQGDYLYPLVSMQESYYTEWLKYKREIKFTKAEYGIPLDNHPSGEILYWRKEDGTISALAFQENYEWQEIVPKFSQYIDNDDHIKIAPNGLYLLSWDQDPKDVRIIDLFMNTIKEISLASTGGSNILFTPDGKGILFGSDSRTLNYTPLDLPLYDISNAWMFCQDKADLPLFAKEGGLLRETAYENMFQVYESENYVNPYATATLSARPLLVTTDAFHEILEAMFSAFFCLNEIHTVINKFDIFIAYADEVFKNLDNPKADPWKKLFTNMNKIRNGIFDDEELRRVEAADEIADSDVLKVKKFDYAEFKPRGYYEHDKDWSNYFRAVQYLKWANLNGFPLDIFLEQSDLNRLLKDFVEAYRTFISPPRHHLPGEKIADLPYWKHKEDSRASLFPGAWGIDNEILNSMVYHIKWPPEEQVDRFLPNILEIPLIFGSSQAKKLLQNKNLYHRYPTLFNIHKDLISRWQDYKTGPYDGAYDLFLKLIAVQVNVKKPDWPWLTHDLWDTKQLITGLASWTNLRHATILVNERGTAEGGEGSWETIIHKPPRGYVEPNPEAFEHLLELYKKLKQVFLDLGQEKSAKSMRFVKGPAFIQGVIKRVDNVILNLERFKSIAEKELNDIPLTNEDYALILAFGRAFEHDYLMFKSILTKGYGLPVTEPMAKTADVFGTYEWGGILHTAIGNPLEWEIIVPHYGQRQMVKGAVYSFYDFVKPHPISDKEWREILPEQALPEWIKPFVSKLQSWKVSPSFGQ